MNAPWGGKIKKMISENKGSVERPMSIKDSAEEALGFGVVRLSAGTCCSHAHRVLNSHSLRVRLLILCL